MITINFENYRTIYLEPRYIKNLKNLFRDSYQYSQITKLLEKYSFNTWDNLKSFTNQDINIKVSEENSYLLYSIKGFEYLLKILEPIYLYRRDQFDLLQVNILPNLYIYTYSGIWEEDFDKFIKTPKEKYDWDNCPKELNSPYSNMQVQSFEPNTHIAIIYHYYLL